MLLYLYIYIQDVHVSCRSQMIALASKFAKVAPLVACGVQRKQSKMLMQMRKSSTTPGIARSTVSIYVPVDLRELSYG